MRSPICNLEESIAGVASKIAPEKENECAKYRDRYGISIDLIDDNEFSIRVNLSSKTIILPFASLEYLWVFANYCWILTQEYAAAQRNGAKEFDCVGNARLRNSHELLGWSKNNLSTTGLKKWPSGFPAPVRNPEYCSDTHVANELFLCSLGWMVHHEMGHIILQHAPLATALSEQEEKDADRHATDWLLSGLEENVPMMKKRAVGIAVGVLCLQSLEVNTNSCLRNTHPNAHDRIFDCLSEYKVGNEEVVEAFAIVVMQYLFHEKGIMANIDVDSFESILGELLFDVSRSKNS
ncbi:MAG: phage exclusion protein Lit family protein [Bacteroidales bacterium]|jgi:hypothetical protein|nr:phage exclusion protein Lit family protein [Bacteroidales bacterium]